MNEIDRWMDSGAEVQEGLRLLNIYAPNRHLDALVRKSPQRFIGLLERKLAGHSDSHRAAAAQTGTSPSASAPVTGRTKFRDNWPFLSDPDCPAELKILAADKITAWEESVRGHEELFQCTTPEQCFEIAKKVVENNSNNRKIFSEFVYYREHRSILGEHPIFRESQRMAELRSLPVLELVRRKENLEEAIWRAGNEIAKGTKPHLRAEREERIREKQRLLAEVNRMLKDYENQRYGSGKEKSGRRS